jgi:NAD(P)-dependent dehydrogenase (short-subunit alcohol dehydrogenase family)
VGPNSLGEATALAIASQGPGLLILTARDPAKAQAVADKLKAQSPQVSVRVVVQDLASFASVRKAAAEVNAMPENIDLLINNAGVMSVPERTLSVDGYEMHFAVNHLGHFLFANLILDKLLAAAKAPNAKPGATRVINLTGNWHNMSPVRFSDINFTTACVPDDEKPNVSMLSNMGVDCTNRAYIPEAAYGQSKSANILFCLYIKQKLAKQGINAVALNPGGILTNIGRHYGEERVQQIIKSGILNKNPDQGSATTLVAAFDPALNGQSRPLTKIKTKKPSG